MSSVRYGQGAGHVLFNYVVCQGTETSLWQCNLGDLYSRECGHTYDVGVVCNISKKIHHPKLFFVVFAVVIVFLLAVLLQVFSSSSSTYNQCDRNINSSRLLVFYIFINKDGNR